MASRDIHDVFRQIASDERVKEHQGLALGRGVVDGVFIYEIRVTDFDFDDDAVNALREIADREELSFDSSEGMVVLRQRRPDGA